MWLARGADVGTEIFRGDKFSLAQWVISRSSAVTFVNQYLFDVASSVFGRSMNFYIIENRVIDPGEKFMARRKECREALREQSHIPSGAKVLGRTDTFRGKKDMPFLD
jgi:hypothetical protein